MDVEKVSGAAVWQRNYFETVMRSKRERERRGRYIAGNPPR